MLDETKADESLEKVMKMAEDDIFKAKTPEEKSKAQSHFNELHKIYNDRLKAQNDRLISEGKQILDAQRFDHDKEAQEEALIEEKKSRKKELIMKSVIKGVELTVGIGVFACEVIMLHNNLIPSDSFSKNMSRTFFGKVSDYFRG